MHLYNEREEEQGGGEFMEDKNFTRGKKFRIGRKSAIGILECGCNI